MAVRAALDAARVVFAPLIADGAGFAPVEQTPDVRAWPAAASVLQACIGRIDMDGQALVGEARRLGLLSLEEAYVLVALHSSPTDRPTGTAVIRALESAVAALDQVQVATERAAEVGVSTRTSNAGPAMSTPAVARPSIAPPSMSPTSTPLPPLGDHLAPRRFSLPAGLILAAVVVVLLGGAGAWYALSPRGAVDDYAQGVEAYQRDAREVARLAFARAAKAHPDDARALVFLGRLAREDGDLPAARRFLDTAIRIGPGTAMANREMASVLLADGNTDVARRFYVRALQLDPTDQLAQGFLACALVRLGRVEEAQRWSERAGAGDWSACVSSPASSNSTSSRTNAATPNSGAAPAATIPSPARP